MVLTAEAHREAEEKQEQEEEEEVLPWANIKFNRAWDGKAKIDVKDSPLFQKLEEYGIPAGGQSMTIQEVARYKYHIDLGGTGGKLLHDMLCVYLMYAHNAEAASNLNAF